MAVVKVLNYEYHVTKTRPYDKSSELLLFHHCSLAFQFFTTTSYPSKVILIRANAVVVIWLMLGTGLYFMYFLKKFVLDNKLFLGALNELI